MKGLDAGSGGLGRGEIIGQLGVELIPRQINSIQITFFIRR